MSYNLARLTAIQLRVQPIVMACGYEPTDAEILIPNAHCPNEGLCGYKECKIVAVEIDRSLPVLDMRSYKVKEGE